MHTYDEVTFSGSWRYITEVGFQYESEGYSLKPNSIKRGVNWPWFWTKSYTMTMIKTTKIDVRYNGQDVGNAISSAYAMMCNGYKINSSLTTEQQLEQAVKDEKYELAAVLRDRIKGK